MTTFTLDETLVYGGIVVGALGILSSLLMYKTSSGYIKPRLKQFFRGGKFIEEVDINCNHRFACVNEDAGFLIVDSRHHKLRPNTALRNEDGSIYQVHKDLGITVSPPSIHAANNLNSMGFKSFAHAATFYKQEYFKDDWEKAAQLIKADPNNAAVINQKVEEKIGLSLMNPVQDDQFTQDLSIMNDWNNQNLQAYGQKNLNDKVKIKAEMQSSGGGLSGEKLMTYAFAFAALFLGVAFGLILLNAGGILHIKL